MYEWFEEPLPAFNKTQIPFWIDNTNGLDLKYFNFSGS